MSSCLKNDISTLPEPVKRPINLSNPVEVYHELSDLNDLPESEEEYDTVFVDTSLVIYDYQSKITTSNGGAVFIPFYSNRAFEKLSVSIKGSGAIIDQPFIVDSINNRVLFSYQMPVKIEEEGTIRIEYWVTDSLGYVSNIAETEIEVLKLGQGTLQISFSWDNTADLDIWLIEPSAEKIYYGHKKSATGGELDRDDVDGFGPENIYWTSKPPEGQYIIKAHLYNYRYGDEIAQYSININFQETTKTFTGKLDPSNMLDEVATFVIENSNISFIE